MEVSQQENWINSHRISEVANSIKLMRRRCNPFFIIWYATKKLLFKSKNRSINITFSTVITISIIKTTFPQFDFSFLPHPPSWNNNLWEVDFYLIS